MDRSPIRYFLTLVATLTFAMAAATPAATAANPIQHIIIIMQENRSFDTYFGAFGITKGSLASGCTQTIDGLCRVTWPSQCMSQGVKGIPIDPTQSTGPCVAPWADVHDLNAGANHDQIAAQTVIDDGITTAKLDGFAAEQLLNTGCTGSLDCTIGQQEIARFDTMGYHTATEIPNYWSYAQNYLMLDHMFEPARSWSWLSHLYDASLWGAHCTSSSDPSTCSTTNDLKAPNPKTVLPWVTMFQLFDAKNVAWRWYLGQGSTPDCNDGEGACPPQLQTSGIPGYWNPAQYFAYVQNKVKGQPTYLTTHVPNVDQFFVDVNSCSLPNVAWVVPSSAYSEHPLARTTTGMEYVTAMVNAIMNGPTCNGTSTWDSTVIFLTWDDWGGFYDHVLPPTADCIEGAGSGKAGGTPPCTTLPPSSYPVEGYGIRVPAIVISPWLKAEKNNVNSAVYSFDQIAVLAENWFAGSARLNPARYGSKEVRPDLRDEIKTASYCSGGDGCPGGSAAIGDLRKLFDFTQAALPVDVLSNHIPTGIAANCSQSTTAPFACTATTVTVTWNEIAQGNVPGPFTDYLVRDNTIVGSLGESSTNCPVGVCTLTDTLIAGSGAHYYWLYSVDTHNIPSPNSAQAEVDE